MIRIWIDADASPKTIKEMLYKAAERLKIKITLVAHSYMSVPITEYVSFEKVEAGFDAADSYIVNHLEKNHLVITADVLLAAEVVKKGALALDPRGRVYDEVTTSESVAKRNLMQTLREGRMVENSGPRPFNDLDKKNFAASFEKMISLLKKREALPLSRSPDKHNTLPQDVRLFNLSHMGQINVTGRGASEWLQQMTTHDISKLNVGQIQYNTFSLEHGRLVENVNVYKRGLDNYFLCLNASNMEKDFQWMQSHVPKQGVVLENLSDDYAQISIEGPKSFALLQNFVDIKISQMAQDYFAEGKILGVPSLIARTSRTGELAYEVSLPAHAASKVWCALLNETR